MCEHPGVRIPPLPFQTAGVSVLLGGRAIALPSSRTEDFGG